MDRHPAFDRVFVLGTLALALGLGAVAALSPALLLAIVLLDIWLFANPHLVATYTRLTRGAEWKRHGFVVFVLPGLVFAGLVVVALAHEASGLITLYFVAQAYHVARQSFGIARAYRHAASAPARTDPLADATVYLFSAWGLLARCAEAPAMFLGQAIHLPAVPVALADATGAVAIACGTWWVWRRCRAASAGRAGGWHDAFVASHVCVTVVAYVWVDDITLGWLVLNIWHNIQYLLFVQVQNVRREWSVQHDACRAAHPLTIRKGAARYAGVCASMGAALYLACEWVGAQLLWLGLPMVLVAHLTLSFHHYLVDGVIWKRRRDRRAGRFMPAPPSAPRPSSRNND